MQLPFMGKIGNLCKMVKTFCNSDSSKIFIAKDILDGNNVTKCYL